MSEVAATDQMVDQEFLKNHGRNVYNTSKNARMVVESIWTESTQAYNSIFSSKENKNSNVLLGQSRLFIPKTYNTVQRILTDIVDALFFDPDEIVSIKSNKETPEDVKKCIKALLNYRLSGHPINFYQEVYEAVLDALKTKVGIFKVYPKLKVGPVEKGRRKEMDEEGKEVEVIDTEERVLAFEPRIECVPPEDLFIHPEATWKDYWKFPMVHRFPRTRAELKSSGFKNVDVVQTSQNVNLFDQVKLARNSDMIDTASQSDVSGMERVYVYEVWTFLEIEEKNDLEPVVFHMLGGPDGPEVVGKMPVKNTLPYKFSDFEETRPPFVIGQAFPESHKLYGKDIPEITSGLQKETNILRNQDREAAALSIRKPVLVNRDAGIDMMALVNRKIGGIVQADETGADAVREIQMSNPIINTAAISARIDQDYFEATSITPNQLGVSVRDETATAVTTNAANANKKIQNAGRNIINTLIIPTFKMLLRLEQAYESDAFIQEVTGKVLGWKFANDGIPAWNKIQGEFDISVDLGINKAAQLNKYLLIMDRINQTNAAMMQLIQSGVMSPEDAGLLNPMWAFREAMGVLKHKNTEEMMIPARAPAPQVEMKGVASQPRNMGDPMDSVSQINPEMLNEILG